MQEYGGINRSLKIECHPERSEPASAANDLPAEQGGEIVGYASVAMVPLMFCWAHSQKVRARDSFRLLHEVEAEAARICPTVVLPCAQTSPFYPLMGRLGYQRLGPADWHFKQLTKV